MRKGLDKMLPSPQLFSHAIVQVTVNGPSLQENQAYAEQVRQHLAQIASGHAKLGLTRLHYDVFLETFVNTIQELGGQPPTEGARCRCSTRTPSALSSSTSCASATTR
jgi:hypothetical protein